MPNSNGRPAFGRRSGTVTVIEEPVRRNAARTAKIVFYVVWITVGLLAATVAASKWHPIIALFLGAAIGAATGLIAAAFIIAWPVLRAIWWWLPELLITASLIVGWIQLAAHTDLSIRLCRGRRHHRRPRRHPPGPPLPHRPGVVPDHPAPAPDLL